MAMNLSRSMYTFRGLGCHPVPFDPLKESSQVKVGGRHDIAEMTLNPPQIPKWNKYRDHLQTLRH